MLQGSVGIERADTEERKHAVQVKRRDWQTSPLWMQLVVIAAAVMLVAWLLDEIF